MKHTWDDFNKFTKIEEYLPARGEGETIATQASTAINKIVYKWFNDGDVFDNTYFLSGWGNDISTYANWLFAYIEGADDILRKIDSAMNDDDYTDLLYNLCEFMEGLDWDKMDTLPKKGSVYEEKRPFKFVEDNEEDEDYWY